MRRDDRHTDWILFLIGLPFVVWAALLAAPYCKGGLPELFWNMDSIINHPFDILICGDTKSCVLFLLSGIAIVHFDDMQKTYPFTYLPNKFLETRRKP